MALKLANEPANFGEVKKALKIIPKSIISDILSLDQNNPEEAGKLLIMNLLTNLDEVVDGLIILNKNEETKDNIEKESPSEVLSFLKKVFDKNKSSLHFLAEQEK